MNCFFFLRLPGKVPIVKLADLEHQEDNRCIIIGTLYKHQQWKPSILRELSEETAEVLTEHKDDYCDEKDQPFLEDEMLRIKLVGDRVNINEIITGVVCAVLGHKTELGTFDVRLLDKKRNLHFQKKVLQHMCTINFQY